MSQGKVTLKLRRLGINTYNEPIAFMHSACTVCQSEGFTIPARIRVSLNNKSITATLNTVSFDLLKPDEISLSEYAWAALNANEGQDVTVSHPRPVDSLNYIHKKIYGKTLSKEEIHSIIEDISQDRYSNTFSASFITACAGSRLNKDEIIDFTKAMISTGSTLSWPYPIVVDKHCVGGLPGNRTTPIIVSIVTAFGLPMPKTSSRAITSASGTADTMEVLTPVGLDLETMRKVVEQEKGCFVWGGNAKLSPADDILVRIQKTLDLDNEGLLVASVLSKKIAAGSTHVLIDIPIGPTAKIKNTKAAENLKTCLEEVSAMLNLKTQVVFTDGTQPIGFGIGPSLEARDLVSVLKCEKNAPQDLRERSLYLSGKILEFSPKVKTGTGLEIATKILDSGKAWEKFKSISKAQGGLREIPKAAHTHPITSTKEGSVVTINSYLIAKLAKLAGAPNDSVAGIDLHVKLGSIIKKGDPLFTIHASSKGEIRYVLDYLNQGDKFIEIR